MKVMTKLNRGLQRQLEKMQKLGVLPGASTSSYGAIRKPQLVSFRGIIPYNKWGNGVNGRSDTRAEARVKLKMGPYDVSQIQLGFANFYASGNATPEAAIGNDVTVEAGLELTNPAIVHRMFFRGQTQGLMSSGCPLFLTDVLNIGVPAFSNPYARMALSVASNTLSYPAGIKAAITAGAVGTRDSGSLNSFASNQVMATGDMVANGGSAGIYLVPTAILGVPVQKHPSVLYLGDSIAQGTGDTTDTFGNVGFIQRGLYDVRWNGIDHVTIPNLCASVGGDVLVNNLDNLIGKRAYFQYMTDVVVELSTNDIQNGVSLANLQTYVATIAQAITRTIGPYGVPVRCWWTLPMPRTNTSNNGWANSAFQPGGVRDQLITWLKAQAGTLFSGVIDANQYVEDPANPGLWLPALAPGDGTHPTVAGHIAAAQAINTWASKLTV